MTEQPDNKMTMSDIHANERGHRKCTIVRRCFLKQTLFEVFILDYLKSAQSVNSITILVASLQWLWQTRAESKRRENAASRSPRYKSHKLPFWYRARHQLSTDQSTAPQSSAAPATHSVVRSENSQARTRPSHTVLAATRPQEVQTVVSG
jgi:hypothetical protein